MESFHAFNVALHVVSGVAALAVGVWPMLSAKGSPVHVWTGRVFVSLAAFVFATALIGDVLFNPPAPQQQRAAISMCRACVRCSLPGVGL